MSYTTIAELRLALGVGTLYADAILQEVCDAADNALIPFLWNNDQFIIGQSNVGTLGTLYFDTDIQDVFSIGQSVTISNSGSFYNGSKTITAVSQYSFDVTTTHSSNNLYRTFAPYGTASPAATIDYSLIPAIQEASLMISVSIFTSRQTNSGNGMQPDGSMGNMYAMSSQLIARVRGLLAPYLSPNSMVG